MKCLPLLIAALLLTAPALRAANVIDTLGNSRDGFTGLPGLVDQFATAFDTGASAARLSSVTVKLARDVGTGGATVQLWSSGTSSTTPENLVEDLGTITVSNTSYADYTFTSTLQPVLAATTRYWVSVTYTGVSTVNLLWGNSSSSASTTSSTGATLPSGGLRAQFTGGSWQPFSGSKTQLFSVASVNERTVTTTDDDNNGATNGTSLREALAAAASAAGPDLITFDPSLSGKTIHLATAAAGVAPFKRAIEITDTGSVTVDATALPGGIIISDGTATDYSLFRVNAGSTVAFHGVTFYNGGGASVARGGAIQNYGSLTCTRCSFVSNQANLNGGNPDGSNGGAIYSESATLSLTHCTFSGNQATGSGGVSPSGNGGAIRADGGTVALTHCTLSGNSASRQGGGLLLAGSALTLTHTIVGGNTATTSGSDIQNEGSILRVGKNIVQGTISGGGTAPTGPAHLTDAPQLAGLAFYGGSTPTMPPLIGSPALDPVGGDSSSLFSTDQRGTGYPRVVNGIVDIGAVEREPAALSPIVMNTNDSGPGSLRDTLAVTASNPGADTITFDAALSGGTIQPTNSGGNTAYTIAQDVTIDATALPAGVTLDGQSGDFRFFRVNEGASLTLRGLTLTRGGSPAGGGSAIDDGGAIYSLGTLTLSRCTLTGNRTNVGGILGGAIFSAGPLELTQCTLSGNFANMEGGAIFSGAALRLTHCTIAGNAAGAGGGVSSSGSFALVNSIVAGNTAAYEGGGADVHNGGVVTREGASLVLGFVNIPDAGTVEGAGIILTGAPKLMPLAANGGPTQTMLPLPGSPAIDAATVSGLGLTTDQRGSGFARALDGDGNGSAIADIGAVELRRVLVTTKDDQNDTLAGAQVSLREALRDDASGITPADAIAFDPAVFTGGAANIISLGSQITVTSNVAVDGSGIPGGVTLNDDTATTYRLFTVASTASLTLSGLTLANGGGSGFDGKGGAISINPGGTLALTSCTLTGNTAAGFNNGDGGAIYNDQGTLTLTQCTLSGNAATQGNGDGGAICNSGGTVALTRCTLSGNTAAGGNGGGAIINFGNRLTLAQCTFHGNSAAAYGGALSGVNFTPTHCTLFGNTAGLRGGAIYDQSGSTILTNSVIADNSAAVAGPDIYLLNGSVTSNGVNVIGKTDGSNTTWNGTDFTGTIASPLDALVAPPANNSAQTQTCGLFFGSPARNGSSTPSEVQLVTRSGSAGTFTLTFKGQTTAALAYNASAATVQTALTGLSTVGAGNATVTKIAFGNDFIVTFRGALAAANQPALTATGSGGTTTTVSTAVEGGINVTSDQRGYPIRGAKPDIGAFEVQGSSTSLISSVNPSVFGQSVTFTATVTPVAPETATPTGTVTFAIGGVPQTPVALNASGVATLTTSAVSAGTPAVTAFYNGSALLLTSGSNTVNQSVLDLSVGNGNDSGNGSLRQALINAAANPGPDTITLTSSQTLTLNSELLINDPDPVTIDATGLPGGFTITDADVANHRLLHVQSGSTLTVRGVTFANGGGFTFTGNGAAILNEGTLTLDRCTVIGSETRGGGGGLYAATGSTTTVDSSSFASNTADTGGGGLCAAGNSTLNMTRCSLSNNIHGGMRVSGSATLTQCTLSHNFAHSGANLVTEVGSSVSLVHCTVAVGYAAISCSGVLARGTLSLQYCLLGQNSGAEMPPVDLKVESGTTTLKGVNLIEKITGTVLGPTAISAKPLLNVLANYAGPTSTMPPLVGSPAIDQAAVLSPALLTDQRGSVRPLGLRPDLGAVEADIITVTTAVDELDAPGTPGTGLSLREAVRDVPAGGTVAFDRAIFTGATATTNTITLTKGPLNPPRNCTLNGSANPGGMTILTQFTITQQPQSLSVVGGAAANFLIVVTNVNGGVAYQWRKGTVNNGTTTAALNIAIAQESDEAVYDVNISELASAGVLTLVNVIKPAATATSQPASLIVDGSALTLKRHPINAMIALGSSHTLSVIAAGPGTLTYQWTLNGKNISGATKSSYLIAKAALTNAGTYRCVVKSDTTPSTSDPAEIGVVDTTFKTVNLLASPTASFTAAVNAAGTGTLTYVWLKNGGGTAFNTKSFTLNKPVLITDSGLYTCTVTGLAGTFTGGAPTLLNVSNAAPQLVLPLALPAATIGQAYFYQLPVQSIVGAPATSFSVTGALPTGLVFNTTTGVLSGRPTVTKLGGYSLSFKAINAKTSSALAPATLTVNVVPPNAVGVFAGPVERSSLNDNLGGRFDLTTTAAGGFSGSLTLGARAKLGFTAQLLQSAGSGDVILYGKIPGLTMSDKTPLTTYIEVFAVEQLARLTLIHPNGTTLVIPAWRNQWTKTKLATAYAAYYTMRLDPQDLGTAPRGYGYASFTVKPDGTLTLAGKLPDGSDVTGGTFVGPDGQILLFNLLYANRGSHVGQFTVTPATPAANNVLSGTTSWFKPAPLPTSTDTVYKAGFGPLTITAAGGVYVPPTKGLRVMGLLTVPNPNARLSFTLGGLAPEFTQLHNIVNPSATGLTNTALITAPATNTTKLPTLTASNGLFAGSFQINGATTALHRPAPFFGQIVKIGATTQGYGYFLLPTATPKISTSPKLSGRVVLGVP